MLPPVYKKNTQKSNVYSANGSSFFAGPCACFVGTGGFVESRLGLGGIFS